jgi:hypothetical protein
MSARRRTGLGRHGALAEGADAGDPLDGLVNLFDIGIVLAIAFLVAGLGLTRNADTHTITKRAPQPSATPVQGAAASGRGSAVGTVYRLADGRLVLVQPNGRRTPIHP